MDNNKNVDSQKNEMVSAADLKNKLQKVLVKQSAEEEKIKKQLTQPAVIEKKTEADIDDIIDKSQFNAETVDILDIEELMKKYLPETDLKFAHPLNLNEIETAEKKEKENMAAGTATDLDEIIGQAEISRKNRIVQESAYYSDGKVSDEYVGDDNIYKDPETDNTPENISADDEIKKIQVKRNAARKKIKNDTDNKQKEQLPEQETQLLTYTQKPVQTEQLDILNGKTDLYQLKRGSKTVDATGQIKISDQINKKPDLSELPDTGLVPDKPHDDNEIDDTDVKLMMAFGMDDELAQTVGFDKVEEVEEQLERKKIDFKEAEGSKTKEKDNNIEFNSVTQVKEIFKSFRSKYTGVLLRLIASFVLLVITFFFENIELLGGSLPTPVDKAIFPVVNIMIDLQLLLLGAALIYKQLIKGTAALFSFSPQPESVTAVIFIISVLYQVAACFTGLGTGIYIYNFPVLLCVFMTLLFEYFNIKREILSFNIIASKRVKYAIVKKQDSEASLETEAFGRVLPESPQIFKINKAMFIDGFFARLGEKTRSKIIINIIIPVLTISALIFFAFCYIYTGKIYLSISQAYITLLIGMPFSLFITYSYPFYKASKEAYAADSAIIGESSLYEYSDANAISFDDRDVFPSYGVKVKSVKVYGDNRIDYIIYNAASLFIKTGGPLADVFDVATRDLGHSDNVDIIQVDTNGIEAMIDGAHIFVGKAAYIQSKGFNLHTGINENENDADGEISTMYMALNNELAAKMYVQYVIDPDFEFVLKQLRKIGICVGIKTFDPNIDDQMLSTKVKISKYPVKVLKCKSTADFSDVSERINSGIVSKNSAKVLLQTLSLCGKVINVTRNNIIVKIFSVIISLILSAIIMLLDKTTSIPSVYIALYQIFWMIPMFIITHISINRI